MKFFTNLFLSVFYIGFIKIAPGTWGSFASILILFILIKVLSLFFLLVTFILLIIASNYLINYYSSLTNTHDASCIVIDELLGIFTILLFYDFIFIYNDIFTLGLIFFTFRFYDIIKIFPANYIDQNFKNGFGVIFDDIIAGIYTIFTLVILNVFV